MECPYEIAALGDSCIAKKLPKRRVLARATYDNDISFRSHLFAAISFKRQDQSRRRIAFSKEMCSVALGKHLKRTTFRAFR